MKFNRLLLLCLFSIVAQVHAQGIGTMNLSTTATIERIKEVSGGRFLTIGADNTNANRVITLFDANFAPQWTMSFPVTVVTGLREAIELNDGNFAFMFTNSSNGGSVAVMKVSQAGSLLFTKQYSFSAGSMNAFGFAPAANGEAGYVFSGGLCAWENYLIKCDGNGDVVWSKSYQDFSFPGGQTAWYVLSDASGYTVASSYTNSGVVDANVWRTDTAGAVLWNKHYALPTYDRPRRLAASPNGYVLHCADDADGSDDVFFWLDNAGNVSSHLSYTGSVSIDTREFAMGPTGNLVVTGYSANGPNTSKMFVMGTDAAGFVQWQKLSKVVSGGVTALGTGAVYTASGNYALTGFLSGFNLKASVTVTDAAGSGFCVEEPVTVTVGSGGNLVTTNKTFSMLPATTTVTSLNPTFQSFIYNPELKCGDIVGTQPPMATQVFELFPNPGTGKLVLRTEQGLDAAQIVVYSAAGARVWEQHGIEGEAMLNLAHLDAGLYWIHVVDGNHSEILKYVLQ